MIDMIILFLLSLISWDGCYLPPPIDYIVCDEPLLCRHEEGHRLDYQLGWPSRNQEFRNAVDSGFPLLLEDTSCKVGTEECLYSEAYARLWSVVEIDIMEKYFKEFVKFYKE